ncbi:colicin import membrane protein [Maridesulfovibrio ferrireducens]|uniref:Colicin import membrane protein n=1 Tax=Maridesulfovibrio ferrireducens TaxID=246191 RepID=A0A1G9HFE6_9BACT|nr:cell envelope integrity protein TolA [Maridesulfovibrio ferrireducens]SDL11761.1 colicin import membrane protein [Maridesulfovibrio ferrireducens]
MRIIGLLISLLLHAGIIILAMTWSVSSPVKISLDMPVYQVDLVSLAPAPQAPKVATAPVSKPSAHLSKPDAIPLPEDAALKKIPKAPANPVKAPESKPIPKPIAKPVPKPEPKVEKISPKKIKTTNPPKKKVAKPEVKKQEKKVAPVKKTPKKKEVPKKPVKPKMTAEEALAADLASIGQLVEKKEKAKQRAVAKDLASLTGTAQSTAVQASAGGTAGASGLVQVYGAIVMQEVKKHWRYPVFGQKDNLSARVQVSLKASGEITDIKLLDSSGNVDFDDSVLTALRDTEVLPEPPGSSIRTIIVNFNLHDLDQ